MKKYLILFALAFLIIPSLDVGAVVVTTPYTTQNITRIDSVYNDNGDYTYSASAISGTYWNIPIYEMPKNLKFAPSGNTPSLYFNNSDYFTDYTTFNIFAWNNWSGYCTNTSSMDLTFEIYSGTGFWTDNTLPSFYFQFIEGSKVYNCTHTILDNQKVKVQCDGVPTTQGTMTTAIQLVFNGRKVNSGLISTSLAMKQDVGFVCQNTNGDIISNANQNKNDIINNQNQNKQEIIDNQNKNQAQTNEKLDNIDDTLTDTTVPSADGLSGSAGWLPPGPVDSLLTLPLTMLQNVSNNLTGQCQSVTLPLPFVHKNITLPCLKDVYSQIDGLSIWIESIGVIASAFILFGYLINLYNFVESVSSLKDTGYFKKWGGS